MHDGQTFDPENSTAASPDRLDDDPSSEPIGRTPREDAPREGIGHEPGRGTQAPRKTARVASRGAATAGVRARQFVALTRSGLSPLARVLGPMPQTLRRSMRRTPVQLAVAATAVSCLGLAGYTQVGTMPEGSTATVAQAQAQAERGVEQDRASRSHERSATPAPQTPTPKEVKKDAPASADPDVRETKPQLPPGHLESGPVAGLSVVQMNNAKAIVWTGVDMGMPRRALIIAVATSMQESNLFNRASEVLPESKQYPHQGSGWDHDSVGLFQQRTSSGWGPVGKLMDPAYASQQFYQALMHVPGWQNMPLTLAAQAVQHSAFPWYYAKHEARATAVVDALTDVR